MQITKKLIADKIAAYLHHDITLAGLVDGAEHAMTEDEFEDSDLQGIRSAVWDLSAGFAATPVFSAGKASWRF